MTSTFRPPHRSADRVSPAVSDNHANAESLACVLCATAAALACAFWPLGRRFELTCVRVFNQVVSLRELGLTAKGVYSRGRRASHVEDHSLPWAGIFDASYTPLEGLGIRRTSAQCMNIDPIPSIMALQAGSPHKCASCNPGGCKSPSTVI